MDRKQEHKRSKSAEIEVLNRSRQRCCICYGLHRDDSIKRGKITHLDGNPQNTIADNLAFLCLLHHKEFDSGTSQSKSLQVDKVMQYRAELYDYLDSWKIGISLEGTQEPTFQDEAKPSYICKHCGGDLLPWKFTKYIRRYAHGEDVIMDDNPHDRELFVCVECGYADSDDLDSKGLILIITG